MANEVSAAVVVVILLHRQAESIEREIRKKKTILDAHSLWNLSLSFTHTHILCEQTYLLGNFHATDQSLATVAL